ncbi:MAG TPA: amidase family protein [Acidimicrobiales bacterium]|nr:amidase family protein [Acidimicrobiales bacterium]
MDFRRSSVTSLAGMVRDGRIGARELTGHALARIEALNPTIGAFVAVDGERALEQAAAVDQLVATGADPGPLAGIPIGVKDLEDAAGYVTTHGSPVAAGGPPATADSALVARLRAAGCVVVGKTNTPEFGWAAKTENSVFGRTVNPWNPDHSPGGSSGGSAAAVAAGMVPLATGSDGGGSIRIPSSCCGLSGMKPSLGRVPAGGPEPPGWLDLSTKGPIAARMADIVIALDAVVGPEPTDLRSLPRPEASWPAVLDRPKVPARVAWSPTLGYATVDREVLAVCERALAVLEGLGAEVVELDTVFDKDPVGPWLTIVSACLARTYAPYIGTEAWDKVDPGLRALVERARGTSALDLVAALDASHRLNLALVEVFHDVRLLVTPTLAGAPPPVHLDGAGLIDGDVDVNWVRFTYPFNMTRSPAATVCAGLTAAGLPVGLQLIGPQHADLVVMRSAAALETALAFDQVPALASGR